MPALIGVGLLLPRGMEVLGRFFARFHVSAARGIPRTGSCSAWCCGRPAYPAPARSSQPLLWRVSLDESVLTRWCWGRLIAASKGCVHSRPGGAGRVLHEGGVLLAGRWGHSTKVGVSCSMDNPWSVHPHPRAVADLKGSRQWDRVSVTSRAPGGPPCRRSVPGIEKLCRASGLAWGALLEVQRGGLAGDPGQVPSHRPGPFLPVLPGLGEA